MSEESKAAQREVEELEALFGNKRQVMTVVLDESKGGHPVVDLGTVHPHTALAYFREIVKAIEMTVQYPQIMAKGQMIFEPPHLLLLDGDWDDDDDEDDEY